MNALKDPVTYRILFYILSPLIAAIPVSWAGIISVQLTEDMHLLLDADLGGMVVNGALAAAGSFAVFAKWGVKK